MESVSSFQKSLDENKDNKQFFINAENSDTSDSESESPGIKIVQTGSKFKKNSIDTLLLDQYIQLQKIYNKAVKTICKLQTEIDTEEIKKRYLVLELNNLQVKLNETNDDLKSLQKTYRTTFILTICSIFLLLVIVKIFSS